MAHLEMRKPSMVHPNSVFQSDGNTDQVSHLFHEEMENRFWVAHFFSPGSGTATNLVTGKYQACYWWCITIPEEEKHSQPEKCFLNSLRVDATKGV